MAHEKVLLVDDEEEFTSLVSERMQARGLRVHTVASGEAALERVRGDGYDVVILDLAMPGMDGIQTLRELLAIHPDLQVILLTGQATVEKSVEAMKLGAREVLEKPMDLNALLQKISEAKDDKILLVEKRLAEWSKEIAGTKGW